MAELRTVRFDDLDLVEVSQEETDMEVDVSFPFFAGFPASTGMELDGGHDVVYFEIEPGNELGTHTDSPEELVICLDGGAEAWAGEETATVEAGEMAVVPAMAPHGFRNTGDETARFVGIFSDSTVVSEFEEPLEPFDSTTVKTFGDE